MTGKRSMRDFSFKCQMTMPGYSSALKAEAATDYSRLRRLRFAKPTEWHRGDMSFGSVAIVSAFNATGTTGEGFKSPYNHLHF